MLTRLKKLRNRNSSECELESVLKIKDNKRSKNTGTISQKNNKKNIHMSNSIASIVYMVQPTHFYTNQETKSDNAFMQDMPGDKSQGDALKEFNNFVEKLKLNKINVEIFKQMHANAPDSIFLNNWFSTHNNELFPGN